ncbi:MAG: hypothetical protein L3J46_10420 [Kangiellaceae bacterium]|nr:hypothetical protein [Kangiellaceae bacterium]
MSHAFISDPATVKENLQHLINKTLADELIMSVGVFDQSAKLHSCELLAEIGQQLAHT